MKVSIIGSGYVGTTLAACLADVGHHVTAIDIDSSVVEALNAGETPIHEPGLDDLVERHSGDRLRATTDYAAARETDLTFLALPTPSTEDGHVDLGFVETATRTLGEALESKDAIHVVAVKSTVVPGSTEGTLAPVLAETAGKTIGDDLHLATNPEFLREGSAVSDLRNPDKVVYGTETGPAAVRLRTAFRPIVTEAEPAVVETGIREAEMIKYANNAFLASKVSLVNELGNICKEYGVDAYEVADALGLDDRIGERFLRSGVGWGGSCFPKDMKALIAAARDRGYEPSLLEAAVAVNDEQPRRLLALLRKHVDPTGKRIAVLGLAFKPGTDDVRNSRAIPVIEGLEKEGAEIAAYDPVATENMRSRFPDLRYAQSAAEVLRDAHGAVVVTGWDEFEALDSEFSAMASPVVVDGRRVVSPSPDIVYEGLTW